MAHKVRVNKGQRVIRFHYANCKSYNADFDGDEINVHFPQDQLGRAEAATIVQNDLQYIVPTDGSPIRGLIQDHVIAGVQICQINRCFTKEEYSELVFLMLTGLSTDLGLPDNQVSSTNYYLTSFSSTNYYLTYLRLTRALCLYGPHPPHPMKVCPALSGGGVGPGTWTGERTKGQTARMKHKNVPSAASSSPACASGFRVDTHSTISASKSNANPARKCSS